MTGPPYDESRPTKEPANAEEVVTSHPSHTTNSQHKTSSAEHINGWVHERERHADLGLVDDDQAVGRE